MSLPKVAIGKELRNVLLGTGLCPQVGTSMEYIRGNLKRLSKELTSLILVKFGCSILANKYVFGGCVERGSLSCTIRFKLL